MQHTHQRVAAENRSSATLLEGTLLSPSMFCGGEWDVGMKRIALCILQNPATVLWRRARSCSNQQQRKGPLAISLNYIQKVTGSI